MPFTPDELATIRRYTLQNAIFYQGAAQTKAVLGKVMAEIPAMRAKAKEVVPEVTKTVAEVNGLSLDQQKEELGRLAPEMLVKEHKERENILPPLPGDSTTVVMRLAPYPSGPLHIGNARMVILNDEYVKRHNGKLLLVFDDTIGSEEKFPVLEAFDLIRDNLKWLGVKIEKEYYKSRRMERFYAMAERLIEGGHAYGCFCTSEQLRTGRETMTACAHRNHPIEENQKIWKGMLDGSIPEGGAVVRLKTDMAHKDPAFRDRVLFRITDREHPLVGKTYRVWPLLEVSWAVDDNELGMTHVLRGKDLVIEDMMENAIWEKLGIKGIPFIHYGLLRFKDIKLSKSKSRKEVADGTFSGYDDPRTWSMGSLKRRGIRPEAVRSFVLNFGMSLTDIEVPSDTLYSENRALIDPAARRCFFVAAPKTIRIEGLPEERAVTLPLHPENKAMGTRQVRGLRDVSITTEDFELNRGREVRLKDFCNIRIHPDGRAEFAGWENRDIPKIQWVSDPVDVQVVMPDASVVEGFGESALLTLAVDDVVQFERFGFVRIDRIDLSRVTAYFAHK